MQSCDRRTFIRSLVHASLSACALGAVPLLRIESAQAQTSPALAVRQGTDIPALVAGCLEALGGMKQFVRPSEKVVVKPNIGWDRTPELAANTHPEVVRALVLQCLEAGASQVRVFDRTCNDPRRCYRQSGIQEAVEGIGSDRVRVEHMDERAFREMDIAGARELSRWSFYMPALEADRLINVPVAKHHSMTTLSLGMKNIMGVIGGNRGRLHRNLPEALADINGVVHSDLTLIDATRILLRNGPQGGRIEDVERRDTLIASPDILAADSFAATLFGFRPEEIPTIVAGASRGLGVHALDRVRRL